MWKEEMASKALLGIYPGAKVYVVVQEDGMKEAHKVGLGSIPRCGILLFALHLIR